MSAFLRSALLQDIGVAHGFSTRKAINDGDFRPATEAGKAAISGISRSDHLAKDPLIIKQVHGADVWDASKIAMSQAPCEGDALISLRVDEPVAVLTADCVPLLVASTEANCVAAIHAGWRGLAAGVIQATLRMLREGRDKHDWRVAIGPCISAAHYRVGEELREVFDAALFEERDDGLYLDLKAGARQALIGCGLLPDKIDILPGLHLSRSGELSFFPPGWGAKWAKHLVDCSC